MSTRLFPESALAEVTAAAKLLLLLKTAATAADDDALLSAVSWDQQERRL